SRIASARVRRASWMGRCGSARLSAAVGVTTRTITVQAVVLALGTQRARERERLARLAMAAEQLHRATEAEERVVVGRRLARYRLELRRGALIAARMKQRAAECLADGCLPRLEIAGPAQRYDRGLVVAALQQLAATLVEVVDAVHGRPF